MKVSLLGGSTSELIPDSPLSLHPVVMSVTFQRVPLSADVNKEDVERSSVPVCDGHVA